MLHYTPTSTRTASAIAPVDITGRRLNRLVRGFSPRQRGVLAVDLERGAVRISDLTRLQSTALARVSASTVATVHCPRRKEPSDADIARAVIRLGIENVQRVIDRLRQPELPLVAAE